jgi:hypothetical protein
MHMLVFIAISLCCTLHRSSVQIVTGVVLAVEFPKYNNVLPNNVAIGVLVVICVFVAGFAWSWGPLGWLVRAAAACRLAHAHVPAMGCACTGVCALRLQAALLPSAPVFPSSPVLPSPRRYPPQVPSEIQTLETRAAGMSAAVVINFLFS